MPPAPVPSDDIDRLKDLNRYAILDTGPEKSFDNLTRLAAYICQTPVSLVSLVDEHRQWFKSSYGLNTSETDRDQAFCGYAILGEDPFIVEDATQDKRVKDNPLVCSTPNIRFYAGVPLKSAKGYNLGTLCVIDFVPRQLTQEQLDGLTTLAFQVMCLLENRLFTTQTAHYTQVLEEAHHKALKANQAKSQFLATMSHDIRTPLHGIIGAIYLLSESSLTPQQQDYVKTADTSAHILEAIISDVLDFSKIEANKLVLNPTPTSFFEICTALERILKDAILQKALQFSIDIDPAIPKTLLIDANRLHQILLNLCSNAIKFTASQGEIRLRVKLNQQTASTANVDIAVIDNGIGIDKLQQQKIFLPFVQATTSTYRECGGTGLGLAICSRLLKLMGSQLHLQSELGQGSTFYFSLTCPVVEPSTASHRNSPSLLKAGPNSVDPPIRVLVVEDNPINQKIMQHMLSQQGFSVRLASNGQQACQQFLESPFDLILMDMEMPIMNGEEAAQEIRRYCQHQHKQVPIIMLTAHAIVETRERLLNQGLDGYLTKPIRPPVLFQTIATVLQRDEIRQSYTLTQSTKA